jgi:hypothetical protein
MPDLSKYTNKETWTRIGNSFAVEIVRWEARKLTGTEYRWNYYCYIYPKHSLFEKLNEENMFGGSIIENLHHGCTFCQWARDKELKITSKKYGCDYEHIWDEGELNKISKL